MPSLKRVGLLPLRQHAAPLATPTITLPMDGQSLGVFCFVYCFQAQVLPSHLLPVLMPTGDYLDVAIYT